MKKAIIITQLHETVKDETERLLKSAGYSCTCIQPGSEELRRSFSGGVSPELLVIISPLADDKCLEIAENAAAKTDCNVIFICGADHRDQLAEWLGEYGAEVLPLDAAPDDLTEAVLRLEENSGELRESSELLTKIDDIRLINKAKSVLMKYLRFTEPQSHRHIEKLAMNSRCTRREAAEQVLNKYS